LQSTQGFSSINSVNIDNSLSPRSAGTTQSYKSNSDVGLGKRRLLLSFKNPLVSSDSCCHKSTCSEDSSSDKFQSKAAKKSLSKLNRAKDLQEIDKMINQMGKTETPLISIAPNKKFDGIPSEWHQVYKYFNPKTKKYKLYFKCMHEDCGMLFNKSCNIRDHFRKHNGSRPFVCHLCLNTFTQ
jgi:hypothetical protein